MYYIRIIFKYLKHFFTAWHTGGHGVHSPFLFHFTKFVIQEKHPYAVFQEIENLRKELRNDNRSITITDFGTGKNRNRRVSDISKKALKSKKFGQLLFRIVNQLETKQVIELGTSLGISGAYLATSSSNTKLVTFEGCPNIAQIAKTNFEKLGIKNVEIVIGNIDQTLSDKIQEIPLVDLVFMDANHTSEAVIRYFDTILPKTHKNTIVIIDDIHWSNDMELAWSQIKNYQQVQSTIDLFQLGIVFFNTDLSRKHYKMRF